MSMSLDDVRGRAAKAQAEIDRIEIERRQRLDAKHFAWRQSIIDGYPARRRELEQQATEARDTFYKTVADDFAAAGAAYLAWVNAAAALASLILTYTSVAQVHDPHYFDERQLPTHPSVGGVPGFTEALETAMSRAAANVVADVEDARQAAMDAALSDQEGDGGQ